MKNILTLYNLDWKRVFQNKIALLLVFSLTFIPSLYAWFNIAALWDPYGNTNELKVAVYSDDQKQTFKNKEIQIGSTVIKTLKNNKSINWIFPKNKKELKNGVKTGIYYAGIYIPRTFTKDLMSFKDGNINKPKIEYITNEKINAIAPKITDKAVDSVMESISKNFTDTVAKTVFTELNKAGVDVEDNLPMLRKAKSLVFKLEENQDLIDGYISSFLDLKRRLPEFDQKLQQANTIIDLFPEINSASQKLILMNYRMDDISKVGDLLSHLNSTRSDFDNIENGLIDFSDKFDSLNSTLSDILIQAEDTINIIDKTQEVINSMNSNSSKIDSTISEIISFNQSLIPAFRSIENTVNSGLASIEIMNDSIIRNCNYLIDKLSDFNLSEKDRVVINRALRAINENTKRANNSLENLRSILISIQDLTNNQALFSNIISRIDEQRDILNLAILTTDKFLENPYNFSIEELKVYISEFSSIVSRLDDNLKSLKSLQIGDSVGKTLNNFNETLSSSNEFLKKARELSPKISSLLNSTKNTINNSSKILREYKENIPAVKNKIYKVSNALGLGKNILNMNLDKAINFYNSEFPIMKSKLNTISDFAQYNLPKIELELEKEINDLNEAFPKIENAINIASDFIEKDYSNMKDANQKIANILRDSEKDIELEEAMKLLKADAKKEGDFFSNPINLKKSPLYKIPNYGSSSTPFYTALCLWVGGLLLASMLTTKFHSVEIFYTESDKFFARLLTFLTIGTFQAIIVSLGNLILLDVYCMNPLIFVLSSIFISLIFMTIIYVLVHLFDNIGKGIAIIFLVLSISGGGGNFPIELSGNFFKFINPFLPFTYAVNLLRETIGGIYYPSYFKNLVSLLIFGVIFLILGTIFHKSISGKFDKFSKEAAKSHLFH